MGRICTICGRRRSNERFSGRGHKTGVCKECERIPRETRDAIDQREEIFCFLKQSHISRKNIDRLEVLARSTNPETRRLAQLAIEIAELKPYKRQRLRVLAQHRPDLLAALEETGLILAHGHL